MGEKQQCSAVQFRKSAELFKLRASHKQQDDNITSVRITTQSAVCRHIHKWRTKFTTHCLSNTKCV